VEGLSEEAVTSPDDVLQIMDIGEGMRSRTGRQAVYRTLDRSLSEHGPVAPMHCTAVVCVIGMLIRWVMNSTSSSERISKKTCPLLMSGVTKPLVPAAIL
jgi:hypothetical protein